VSKAHGQRPGASGHSIDTTNPKGRDEAFGAKDFRFDKPQVNASTCVTFLTKRSAVRK